MSPLVKKEVHLLLPGFLIGVSVAFSNCLMPDFGPATPFRGVVVVFPFLCCPAMALMMALNSFGAEFSLGTFSNLMAQPVPRLQIWRIKISLLAGALFTVGSLWCLFFYLRYAPFKNPKNPQDFWDVFVCVWAYLLVVFSGALWTVLLIRQVAAAFWFTVLTPAMILVLTAGMYEALPQSLATLITLTLLGFYSIAGYCLARWLFLRAQDTQWTGGTIAMPELQRLSRWFGRTAGARRWRPRAALWRKELQLHQSQLIIAGVLALLHAVVVVTRKCGHFQKNSATEFIFEAFWMLWLVMPLLVGCAAMAEERKMATLESQLCLPVKRGTQFRIKFLVVLMFSVLLGAMMPWLLEGNRILPDFNLEAVFDRITGDDNYGHLRGDYTYFSTTRAGVGWLVVLNLLGLLSQLVPLLCVAAICAGVAAIAFYGSSLSRNTLQGLAPSVLGLFVAGFVLLVASKPQEFSLGFLWRGPLFFLIAVPMMIAVVAALAYGNCQRVRISGSVWSKNLLTLVAALALVTVVTSAIYYRSWELLSANEPAHGQARWIIAHPPRMQTTDQTITIYLPDGRVWMDRYDWYEPNPFEAKIVEDRAFGGGKFLEGTNWTDVRDCWRDIVGVQRDGSLWVSKTPDQSFYRSPDNRKIVASQAAGLERFGHDNDWRAVSGHYTYPYLLRNDGTLWFWGTNRWSWNKKWPGLHALMPQRLGSDSDWEKVFDSIGRTFLIKTNGQVWLVPRFETSGEPKIKTFAPFLITIGRAPYLENRPWLDVAYLNAGSPFLAGIANDGTFREIAASELVPITNTMHGFYFGFTRRDVQIGRETNWLAVAVGNNIAVTLKADGMLWKWDFSPTGYRSRAGFYGNPPDLARAYPTVFSMHSDWMAVGEMLGGIVSLAADGSLYLWRFESPVNYDTEWKGPLLQVSRRPVLLGNVFNQTN
jgi:hypothetical protein